MSRLVARTPRDRTVALDLTDGRVTSVTDLDAPPGDLPVVSPALIDLQVNGYGGFDFNAEDLSVADVRELVTREWRAGVGTFCPTLVTGPEERICRSLSVIAEARRQDPLVAHTIAGVHVEGPSLALDDGPRGAHDARYIRAPDVAEFARWQRSGGALVRIVTIAPESPGAPGYIAALRRQGVLCAIGHTGATRDEIRNAVEAGARLSTHLGNGAHAELPRHPNYIWTQLAEDRLSASFIADGRHLPSDAFVAMIRAKGTSRSILISDSVAAAGLPTGVYDFTVGGRVTVDADGRVALAGTPYLAGSGSSLLDCVNWAIGSAGLAPAAVLRMATMNPGRLIGLGQRAEIDRPHPFSDLVIIDQEGGRFSVRHTIIGGRIVHSRET